VIFFVLKKLISHIILPPGLFVVILLLAGLFFLMRKEKLSGLILVFIGLFIYLLSIEPVKDFFILPLEDKYKPYNENESCDKSLIVVLGGGIYDRSPDNNLKATLMPDALKRLIYGYSIFKKCGGEIAVTGGRVFKDTDILSEAETMRDMLLLLGVENKEIIMDTESLDTFENIKNLTGMIDKKMYPKIILVTSAYHMPRAVMLAEKMNLKVIPAPTDYKTDRTGYDFDSFLPKMSYLEETYKALHEHIGILFYSLKF
jgi:uncharacterized SAM-binding protein YcdF (DUF218 family)